MMQAKILLCYCSQKFTRASLHCLRMSIVGYMACPRLSIDWGRAFEKAPLLNPYEAHVALGRQVARKTSPNGLLL